MDGTTFEPTGAATFPAVSAAAPAGREPAGPDLAPGVSTGGARTGVGPVELVGPLDTVDDLAGLYEAEHLALLRLARLVTGSLVLAEEAVQDAFITVYERRTTIDNPAAYLRRVVVNNCHSVLRRGAVEQRKLELVGRRHGDEVVLPPELAEVWQALAGLNPRQRTALVLRYHQDLTVPEVAEAMGERLGTVKSLLSRALARLRDEVEP